MINKNKFKIILSSIIILLPLLFGILLWNDLPDTMAAHWGSDGTNGGFNPKVFVIFGLPVIFLVLHFVCLFFTLRDKKQKEQNPKALGIVFWIAPIISLVTCGIQYRSALDKTDNFALYTILPLGILFIIIGNYLPKTKQNQTLGIKVHWALLNEDNWNKTHRFSGKIWVAGGFLLLLSVFLPSPSAASIMVCIVAIILIAPAVYSYYIYRQHRKEGIVYPSLPKSITERNIGGLFTFIILIIAAVIMFTGNITVHCNDTSFQIKASYWFDLEEDYSNIDTIEYRTNFDIGSRTNGAGSPRLSAGEFRNSEFGSYTLYAYTNAKEFIVLTSDNKTLVIGMKDAEDTKDIYHTLLTKLNK